MCLLDIFTYKQFSANDKAMQLIKDLTNIDTDNCSVKEAYELLETYKNRAKNILT